MSAVDKLNMMNDFDFDKVNEEYTRNQAKPTTRSDAVLSLARCLDKVINSVVAQYKPYDTNRKIELFKYSDDEIEFELEVLPNVVEDKYSCRFNLQAIINDNRLVGLVKASTVDEDFKDNYEAICRILENFELNESMSIKITNALTLGNNSHYLLLYPRLYENLAMEAELLNKECSGIDRLIDCLTEVIKDVLRCYQPEICINPVDLIDYCKDKVKFSVQLCTEDTTNGKFPSFYFSINIDGDDDYGSIECIHNPFNTEEIHNEVKRVVSDFGLDDSVANSLAYAILNRKGLKSTEKFTRKYEEIYVHEMAIADIIPV